MVFFLEHLSCCHVSDDRGILLDISKVCHETTFERLSSQKSGPVRSLGSYTRCDNAYSKSNKPKTVNSIQSPSERPPKTMG